MVSPPYFPGPPCVSTHRPILWLHDVVSLTANVIKFLETFLQDDGVLEEFHKGNDQINYGYTDKGLGKANSKDKINFSEYGTQLAYVYRFFTSHVLIMGELLMSSSGWCGVRYPPLKSPVVSNLRAVNEFLDSLSGSHVTITCYGGGPVSEVAAIAAWLRNEGIDCPLLFNVLDKYSAWKNAALEVGSFCNTTLHYKELDFLTSDPEQLLPYSQSQDIICMSKFLSALTAHRPTATRNLRYVLEHMIPGALLIYIDNSGGGTTEWLTNVATDCQLQELFTVPHYAAKVSPEVISPNERLSYFKVKATTTLNVAFKIFQKRRTHVGGKQRHFSREKYYHRVGYSSTSH